MVCLPPPIKESRCVFKRCHFYTIQPKLLGVSSLHKFSIFCLYVFQEEGRGKVSATAGGASIAKIDALQKDKAKLEKQLKEFEEKITQVSSLTNRQVVSSGSIGTFLLPYFVFSSFPRLFVYSRTTLMSSKNNITMLGTKFKTKLVLI